MTDAGEAEREAKRALDAGDLHAAGRALDDAAHLHRDRGAVDDEARLAQLAATVWRAAGESARAEASIAVVLDRAPGSPAAVVALTEQGELAVARGDAPGAAVAYDAALSLATQLGFPADARAALARKRGLARWSAGDAAGALADLETAGRILGDSGAGPAQRAVEAERISALFELGSDGAAAALDAARSAATEAGDDRALADVELLATAEHERSGERGLAKQSAYRARDHALRAVAPMAYVSAALAIASLADATGERTEAYGALAGGWATLGDLLGAELARATFEPKLRELRERWGEAGFDDAKRAYEAERRQAR